MKSLLLHGGTVIGSDLEMRDDVLIREGTVEEIDRYVEEYDEELDVTGKLLFPGFIDCHVHFREPGFEHKATMQTEAKSALAGGVTMVCEMPNTNPPTVTVAALADKVRRAADINDCDMRFFFGITEAIHLATFRELMAGTSEESVRLRQRCCGIKLYLDHSTGNQKVEGGIVEDIFKACAEYNVTLVAHCEDPEMNAQAAAQNTRTDVAAHSLVRPSESEVKAIEYAIGLARTHKTKLHIAHLSTERGLDAVRRAKAEGLSVTCEVTPHHLFLTTDDYEALGTLIKMNPPIRSREHQEALWRGIEDGTVDCVSTDHAPHTIEEKDNPEPLKAPSGVPGVETMIPLLLSVAGGHWPHPRYRGALRYRITYKDIVRLCMENPNKIFNLGKRGIEEGAKTDIVIVSPDLEWEIKGSDLHGKCGWTPFEGWRVRGKVERVLRA